MNDMFRVLRDAYLDTISDEEYERLRDENEYFDEWINSPECWEEGIELDEYNESCRRRDYY